jgi:hypothetical protein
MQALLSLEDTLLESNTASGGDGGAVELLIDVRSRVQGNDPLLGRLVAQLTANNVTAARNRCSGSGGALSLAAASAFTDVTVSTSMSSFSGNAAGDGFVPQVGSRPLQQSCPVARTAVPHERETMKPCAITRRRSAPLPRAELLQCRSTPRCCQTTLYSRSPAAAPLP